MNSLGTAQHVLVVDDSDIVRRLVTSLLAAADYVVSAAPDGVAALDMALAQPPDLVLLDVHMPTLSGFDVCLKLKANDATRHIPVVFLTSSGDVESEDRAFAVGAADYITKPINPSTLLARVRNVVNQRMQSSALEVQFRNAVELAPAIFLFADEQGMVTTANVNAVTKFGYTDTAQVLNRPLDELLPGYLRHVPHRQAHPVLGDLGHIHTAEVTCRRPDGGTFQASASFSRVLTQFGNVLMVALQDTTERSKMLADLSVSRILVRELAARNEAAREAERKRIARDVHDELGQVLSALRMDVMQLRKKMAQPPELVERLQHVSSLVDRAIADVRAIASGLRPVALDMGLASAIEWLCDEFSQTTGLPCELVLKSPGLQLDELRSVVLYRIVQESLNNVAKYAGASRVSVDIWQEDAWVLLHIEDNGCGFDMSQALQRKTFGLLGMQERALVLDGQFQLHSAPGKGTRIDVSFPLVAPSLGVSL